MEYLWERLTSHTCKHIADPYSKSYRIQCHIWFISSYTYYHHTHTSVTYHESHIIEAQPASQCAIADIHDSDPTRLHTLPPSPTHFLPLLIWTRTTSPILSLSYDHWPRSTCPHVYASSRNDLSWFPRNWSSDASRSLQIRMKYFGHRSYRAVYESRNSESHPF